MPPGMARVGSIFSNFFIAFRTAGQAPQAGIRWQRV
jgi:hypothetical protein